MKKKKVQVQEETQVAASKVEKTSDELLAEALAAFGDGLPERKEESAFSLDELFAMDIPAEEWVVEKLIPKGITLLTGASRSYKTFIIQSMTIAISQGLPFLDTFGTKQSNVLVVDEENSRGILRKRYRALNAPEKLPIYFYSMENMKIDNDADVMKIRNFCEKNNVSVVIIDSLVRVHSANENSADEMSRALKQLNMLTNKGISVILIHHHRKQQQGQRNASFESIRGSSDIFAFVDCHIGVDRKEDTIILLQDKLRTDEEMGAFTVRKHKGANGAISFTYEGMAETQNDLEKQVLEIVTASVSAEIECDHAALVEQCGVSRHQITKCLAKLEQLGSITKKVTAHNRSVYIPTPANETVAVDGNTPITNDK